MLNDTVFKVVIVMSRNTVSALQFGHNHKYLGALIESESVISLMDTLNAMQWEVESKKEKQDFIMVYTSKRYMESSTWIPKYRGTYNDGATYRYSYSPYVAHASKVNIRYGQIMADINRAESSVDGSKNKARARYNAMRHYNVTEKDMDRMHEYYTCMYYDC